MNRLLIATAALFLVPLSVFSATMPPSTITFSPQQKFHNDMPPGNYSGIAALGNNRYAVVCDKTADGFYIFHIEIDTAAARIQAVTNEGFRASGLPCRDQEAVAYRPSSQTLFIAGEDDGQVLEYTLDGHPTGQRLAMPADFSRSDSNYGLESLTYDEVSRTFWTVTERPLKGDTLLKLQSFGDDLQPRQQFLYALDKPAKRYRSGLYIHGVSELLALGDGRLLVLEREVRIPRMKVGAFALVKLYEVCPPMANPSEANSTETSPQVHTQQEDGSLENSQQLLQKRLVGQWKTRMNLLRRNFANYEGMCVAHRYDDGRIMLLLIADSQNRYRGLLRDWMRLVTIR